MDYIIETINLTKEFIYNDSIFSFLKKEKKTIIAINNVNLRVKKGEIFGLVGQNGSGKTTLIKLLSTLILPTKGTAYVNGYNVIKDELEVRKSIGLVTNDKRSFYWRLTGKQNLDFFATLYKLSNKQKCEKIKELSDLLGLEKYMDIYFFKYSDGIKQRFLIARSLLNNPPILLMDDPNKNLDSDTAKNLMTFIKKKLVYGEGKTVLFTTTDYDEAKMFSDTFAILDKGILKGYFKPHR